MTKSLVTLALVVATQAGHARHLGRALLKTDLLIASTAYRPPDDDDLADARANLEEGEATVRRLLDQCDDSLDARPGYAEAYRARLTDFLTALLALRRRIDARDMPGVRVERDRVRNLVNDAHAELKAIQRAAPGAQPSLSGR